MAGAEPVAKRPSDLGVRAASAVVMLGIVVLAYLPGGLWWASLVVLVAAGVLFEWKKLVFRITRRSFKRGLWMAGGLIYVGVAAAMLVELRHEQGEGYLLLIRGVLAVIATDVGAYFAGRTIGGPKIAPSISPSKTWAGLAGGMVFSAIVQVLISAWFAEVLQTRAILGAAVFGMLAAIVAQAGDFFESWMKRRARVKDSGNLLPGHGGFFDRVDGLLAVMFVFGIFSLPAYLIGST